MLKLRDHLSDELVIESELSYFSLRDAQIAYKKNANDGSIMLTVNNEATEYIDASLDLTVADAEKLAYYILGMCAAVRNQ